MAKTYYSIYLYFNIILISFHKYKVGTNIIMFKFQIYVINSKTIRVSVM